MDEPNRVKIVSIDNQILIDLLNWGRNPKSVLTLPVCDELPSDCRVLWVHPSFERRCLEAMVWSSEFPEVPLGQEAERIWINLEVIELPNDEESTE